MFLVKMSEMNLKGLEDFIYANLLPEGDVTQEQLSGKSHEEIVEYLRNSRV